MGLDLKIIPQYSKKSDFANTALDTHRQPNLQDKVKQYALAYGRDIIRGGISLYTPENGDGVTVEKDMYGNLLKSIEAKWLVKAFEEAFKAEGAWAVTNEAVLAYLKALPEDWECYIYWC